jgi:hypothetical protein
MNRTQQKRRPISLKRLTKILNELNKIDVSGPQYEESGICNNVSKCIAEESKRGVAKLVKAVCKDARLAKAAGEAGYEWYSGDLEYPVKHPVYPAEFAYGHAPLWEDEYGANRKSMLKALINKVKELMK